jgi:hypothetical protein
MLSQRPVTRKCSPERGPKLTDIAQIIAGLCTDSATSPLSTCTYALHAAGIKRYRVMPMKAQESLMTPSEYQKPQGFRRAPSKPAGSAGAVVASHERCKRLRTQARM